MAETNTTLKTLETRNTIPTSADQKEKPKFNWKLFSIKFWNKFWKLCKIIGSFFGSVAIWELAGIWQPEFREKMPDWYVLIDWLVEVFNQTIHYLISTL